MITFYTVLLFYICFMTYSRLNKPKITKGKKKSPLNQLVEKVCELRVKKIIL